MFELDTDVLNPIDSFSASHQRHFLGMGQAIEDVNGFEQANHQSLHDP